jgi:hypothetical protein
MEFKYDNTIINTLNMKFNGFLEMLKFLITIWETTPLGTIIEYNLNDVFENLTRPSLSPYIDLRWSIVYVIVIYDNLVVVIYIVILYHHFDTLRCYSFGIWYIIRMIF